MLYTKKFPLEQPAAGTSEKSYRAQQIYSIASESTDDVYMWAATLMRCAFVPGIRTSYLMSDGIFTFFEEMAKETNRKFARLSAHTTD